MTRLERKVALTRGDRHITVEDVVDLLRIGRRIERQAVRRAVKRLRWCRPGKLYHQGYNKACDDILAKLERWRKG